MSEREQRTNTRARIREVALELFAEQGYMKTSLREIADRLGVTKAALYYHFKTKEEIITSLMDDWFADLDSLISWAEEQPRSEETRREIVHRYNGFVQKRRNLFRFFQENQSTMRDLAAGGGMKERMRVLFRLLNDPGDPVEQQFRARLAMFAVHCGSFFMDDVKVSQQARDAVTLQVAQELITG